MILAEFFQEPANQFSSLIGGRCSALRHRKKLSFAWWHGRSQILGAATNFFHLFALYNFCHATCSLMLMSKEMLRPESLPMLNGKYVQRSCKRWHVLQVLLRHVLRTHDDHRRDKHTHTHGDLAIAAHSGTTTPSLGQASDWRGMANGEWVQQCHEWFPLSNIHHPTQRPWKQQR